MCTKTTGWPAASRDITCWRLVQSGVSHSCEERQTIAPGRPANGAFTPSTVRNRAAEDAPRRHSERPSSGSGARQTGDLRNSYRDHGKFGTGPH